MHPRARRARFRLARPSWTWPALAYLSVFFLLPLITNLVRSVSTGEASWSNPFVYYVKLITDRYYLGVLLETLFVSIVTTILCLLVSYPISYFMVRKAGRWNVVIVFFLVAPLLTSIIMRTFGWTVLAARRGLFNTWLMETHLLARPLDALNGPVIVYVALVHVLAPFMILSISAVLQTVDVRLEESARLLGAGRVSTFLRVTLPLSLDGITNGCTLVFVLTNGSFLTMLLLGGGTIKTLALLIYQQFNLTQDIGFAAAMGNILLIMALVCLLLQARLVRRRNVKQ
ncbi:MAG TPA: ABC transporter permease [Rhodopila sp.]|uniref:ABC transporter permease n=1 Tax=Rhodopila sp. TaxID=2480087 RepID=UPI002C3490D3|nr:ABC transporter permease [Rhodopila sp.]HVY16736.1 ABC transporter permease [Rhodopila sp.]